VGLERSPLSLVSTTEELLERKSRSSGLENRDYSRRNPSRSQRGTLFPQTLLLTSPVGVARSRSQAREFFLYTLTVRKAQRFGNWVYFRLQARNQGQTKE
jgi:hypothetical protein